jgi:probable rRNA maturation factor
MIFVDIALKSKKWNAIENIENIIDQTCQKIIYLTDLKKLFHKKFHLEMSVSLVCDQQMKKINWQFRSQNKATNVLSFASLDENLIRQVGLKKSLESPDYLFLGDIVIAFETLKKESLEQKKQFLEHLTHIVLHSILHLIGFDHQDEKMAQEMEALEIKILKKLKIKNPYQPIS